MEQNLLLTEIMTDNLILSQEGRQSNADGFRLLLYLTAHIYYNSAYRAAVAASRVINNLNVVLRITKR
jgi:hypothetical protein